MPDSACLEIHVINVSQGDSILIINRDLLALRTNLRVVTGAEVFKIRALSDVDARTYAGTTYAALNLTAQAATLRADLITTATAADKLLLPAMKTDALLVYARGHGKIKEADDLMVKLGDAYTRLYPTDATFASKTETQKITVAEAKFQDLTVTMAGSKLRTKLAEACGSEVYTISTENYSALQTRAKKFYKPLDMNYYLGLLSDMLCQLFPAKAATLKIGTVTVPNLLKFARDSKKNTDIDADIAQAFALYKRIADAGQITAFTTKTEDQKIADCIAKYKGLTTTMAETPLRAKLTADYSADAAAIDALADLDLMPFAAYRYSQALQDTIKGSLLIDGGDRIYGRDVLRYLYTYGAAKEGTEFCPKLNLMLTHYHADHMNGLFEVLEKIEETKVSIKNPKTKKMVITTKKEEKTKHRPAAIYIPEKSTTTDPATKIFKNFKTRVAAIRTAAAPPNNTFVHEVAKGGVQSGTMTPYVIDLGTGSGGLPIRVRIMAANGSVLRTASGGSTPGLADTHDQNDRSLAAMLEYGSFLCLLTGDLAGNGKTAGGNGVAGAPTFLNGGSGHGDVEALLVPAIQEIYPLSKGANQRKANVDGRITMLKAGHHASASSCDINTLGATQPQIMAISSGVLQKFHQHPTIEVTNRMITSKSWGKAGGTTKVNNTLQTDIFVTEMALKVGSTNFAPAKFSQMSVMGDMVFRPLDRELTDNWTFDDSTSGTAPALKVHVYGSGIQTNAEWMSKFTLHAIDAKANTSPYYGMGQVVVTCDKN